MTDRMTAREVEAFLGLSKTGLSQITSEGRLPSELVDEPGQQRKRFYQRADVEAFKAAGGVNPRNPNISRPRLGWRHYFGEIPEGLTVIPLDGDKHNGTPRNLALVPTPARLRRAVAKAQGRRIRRRGFKRGPTMEWTPEKIATLTREFPTRISEEIAAELGCSRSVLMRKAKQLGLRKDWNKFKQELGKNAFAIGTEVVDSWSDFIRVRVETGTGICGKKRWKWKHYIEWEKHNGRPVPKGMRIIFKDGDKRNFAPENLELTTLAAVSARAFANHMSKPAEVQKAISLTKRIEREVDDQIRGKEEEGPKRRERFNHKGMHRWTEEEFDILARDYPTRPTAEVARKLGMEENAVRIMARRRGIRRLPEAMIAIAEEKAKVEIERIMKDVN